jgi:hypothetical protein
MKKVYLPFSTSSLHAMDLGLSFYASRSSVNRFGVLVSFQMGGRALLFSGQKVLDQ